MSHLTASRVRLFLILVFLSVLVGFAETYDHYTLHEPPKDNLTVTFVRGGLTWLFGSSLLWAFEIFFVPSQYGVFLRKMSIVSAIFIKSLVVVCIVMLTAIFSGYAFHGRFNLEFFTEAHYIRVLIIVGILFIALQTATQVIRIIGARALINILLGKYRQPVQENRIFMFLDIVGSTTLAERLGDLGVQHMINEFFFDITEPILEHGGEIHRYIGDQVIVTWPLSAGTANIRVIQCCFAINRLINAKAQKYEKKFGFVPGFRIGLHGGPVVIGHCGDQKQEISYFGDTINTAARIEQQCKALDCPLIISSELLNRISLPKDYIAQHLSTVQLRGRQEETELFTIKAI
ncbi:adenylate/guanylate cyclase domain-containing protein [Kiloniella majae]|uniref:adenylate/guanylate cyclase domain-containing protein n=1 Tax=Kiloniella majae TaxID=1938558 RepID=UPI000A2778D4|nr:adenylate/guanylate cyclase domain-containing protein [Kiloniella majae]